MNFAILGAGSWGTALGQVLCENGSKVLLWHHNIQFVESIHKTRKHLFLPNLELHPSISFTSSLKELYKFGDFLVIALPSQVVREVLIDFPKSWDKPIVSVTKGIENETGKRMSEVITETLQISQDQIVVLSGPSHAEEVAIKNPTAIVAASLNYKIAKSIQDLFSNNYFRVYTSDDLIGVELGGAAKNIIALAAGICYGLGYGDNTTAALVTRGLEEIVRFGILLGAERSTFAGLSGMGDLAVTAFSIHSRNRQVGVRIGKGEKLQDILNDMKMVAEGVETTKSLYGLSKKMNVELPICEQIYQVLFENIPPRTAILQLMSRELVEEHPV